MCGPHTNVLLVISIKGISLQMLNKNTFITCSDYVQFLLNELLAYFQIQESNAKTRSGLAKEDIHT